MVLRRQHDARSLLPLLCLAGLAACRSGSTSARLQELGAATETHLEAYERRSAAFDAHGTDEALAQLPVVSRRAGFQLRLGTREGDTYFLVEPEPGGAPGHLEAVSYTAWVDDDGDGAWGAGEERIEQGGVSGRDGDSGERVSFGWWSEPAPGRPEAARVRVDLVVDGRADSFGVHPLH